MATPRPRVAFYALRDLHLPVLLPVIREVAKLDQCEVGVIAPPYIDSDARHAQEGLTAASLAQLQADGIPFWGHDRDGAYACVVVADACYDRVDGWGPVVCIGHGTISKGLYFTDKAFARRENFARVLCVPGPGYATSFGRHVFTRVTPTGFSKMDELASAPEGHRAAVLNGLGLDPAKRTLLFAPTFNPEFTSLAILLDAWATLDAERDQVLFKLHGATDRAWIARYRDLAASLPHTRLVDGSLSTYLQAADVVISDVSSAYVEALITSQPLIVVNNPAMATYPLFNRADVEYRVRDAAYQVRTSAELHAALAALRTADPLAAKRKKYAQQLFPPLDGRNSERIAAEVLAVASSRVPQQLPAKDDALAVYVPERVVDAARVQANIDRAVSPVTVHRGPGLPPQPFICLTGEFDLPHGWDLVWFMASHFNAPSRKQPVAGIFGPMLPDQDAYGAQRRSACFTQTPALDAAALQTLYKHHAYDQMASADTLCADASIVSKGVSRDVAAEWIARLDDSAGRAAVARLAVRRGWHVGVLPGIYAVPAH